MAEITSDRRAKLDPILRLLVRAAKDAYDDGDDDPRNLKSFYDSTLGLLVSSARSALGVQDPTELVQLHTSDELLQQSWTLYQVTSIGRKAPDSHIYVLAFRGSKKLADWIRDGRVWTENDDVTGMKIHKGFYNGVKNQFNLILHVLQKLMDGKLYITGHSLGGACAVVFVHSLFSACKGNDVNKNGNDKNDNDIDINSVRALCDRVEGVYTFGAPRAFIGAINEEFRTAWNDKVHNFVNGFDIVPRSLGKGKKFRSDSTRGNKRTYEEMSGTAETSVRDEYTKEGMEEREFREMFDNVNIKLLSLPHHLASFQPFGRYYFGFVSMMHPVGAIEERFDPHDEDGTQKLVDEMMDFIKLHRRPTQLAAHHFMNAYRRMILSHFDSENDSRPLASTLI